MITTIALVVIAVFQVAFGVVLLVFLFGANWFGRRGDLAESAAVAALHEPMRALMLGVDHGEALAAALARLDGDVATHQLLSIATSRLPRARLRDLSARVRPAAWVEQTLEGAASRFWWKRMEAARLLAVVGSPADLPLVGRLVCDSHPAVASAATAAIAGQADAALIESVIRGLSGHPTAVRLQHVRALRNHAEVALPVFVAELRACDSVNQLRALIQLAEVLETSGALAAIVPFASHDDAEVRTAVARALRTCFMPAGVDAARALMKDTDWRVRSAAARALGSLRVVDAIPDLRAALRDVSWWVRFRAALALGSFGEEGRSPLGIAAASEDEFARDIAVVVSGLSESARLELSA